VQSWYLINIDISHLTAIYEVLQNTHEVVLSTLGLTYYIVHLLENRGFTYREVGAPY
jgi:hypothetical protein